MISITLSCYWKNTKISKLEAIDVGADHLRELLLAWLLCVFGQQGIGLGDGRQRVADLVGDASGHAAHRGELVLALARANGAQVLQQHDAHVFTGRVGLGWRRAAREAHAQAQFALGLVAV